MAWWSTVPWKTAKKKKNLEHANIFQIIVILELQIIPEYRACDQVYISPPNLKHISEKNLFIIIVQKHTEKYVFVSKILNSLLYCSYGNCFKQKLKPKL